MANCYTINQIPNLKERSIFFDANILIYLFVPTGKMYFESNYSSVFASLIKQNNKFVVDFIVLSEFINRAIRIDYDNYLQLNNLGKNDLSFKQYRNQEDGKEKLQQLYDLVINRILKRFEIVENSITNEDILSMLKVNNLDFNDKAIQNICAKNNFVLLTNDIDYKETSLDILTVNKRFNSN